MVHTLQNLPPPLQPTSTCHCNEPHPQPATNPQCFSSTTNPQCFPRHFHYDSAQSNRRITGKSMRQMAHTKVLHLVTSTKSDTQTPAPTRCSIHKCVFTSAYSQVRIHKCVFTGAYSHSHFFCYLLLESALARGSVHPAPRSRTTAVAQYFV